MSEILVLCPFGLDTGLLSQAAAWGLPVRALVPQGTQDDAARYGASHIHTLAPGPIADEAAFAHWLKEKITGWGSTILLAPATVQMRNMMPLLAWQLGAGLTADCTGLSLEEDTLLQTRPAFGNSLMATIRATSPIQMATVRPGAFRSVPCPVSAPVIEQERFVNGERVSLTGFAPFDRGTPLGSARIVIAGGMGVGTKEGFAKLERLATKLGAGLAASRTAVDAGLAPFRCQVGLTGVTVCPKVYLALGISGAVQHLAGMSGSEKIIAINSDPKAPIFDYADLGIVGDWEAVIDQVLEELL